MKYYVYISDAKVDMLLPQIPHDAKRKIAHELGVDLKIFKATRKVEAETEDNRITRLEAVVKYIREWGNLGTIDKPDEYVEDSLKMRFSEIRMGTSKRNGSAYFGGNQLDTSVGLGGSAHHLIGNVRGDIQSGSSFGSAILEMLDEATGSDFFQAFGYHPLMSVIGFNAQLKGLEESFRFMAKRVAYENVKLDGSTRHVLLLTPLYVTKED